MHYNTTQLIKQIILKQRKKRNMLCVKTKSRRRITCASIGAQSAESNNRIKKKNLITKNRRKLKNNTSEEKNRKVSRETRQMKMTKQQIN